MVLGWKVQAYLHEQEKVRILALGGGPLTFLDMVFCDVDTLRKTTFMRNKNRRYVKDVLTIFVAAGLVDGQSGRLQAGVHATIQFYKIRFGSP